MARSSHITEVYRYLREHGSITPMEALQELGCYRLGARIYELRRQYDIPIKTEIMEDIIRPGWFSRLRGEKPKLTRYARYTLDEIV